MASWGGASGARPPVVEFFRRHWDAQTELAGMKYVPQPSIPGVNVDVVGAYAEYSRILGDRWLLEAGARFDAAWSQADEAKASTGLAFAYLGTRELSQRDLLPSGKLRLAWRPGTGVQLAVGLGHTARVPEASERFFSLKRMGTDWVGDPGLRPSQNSGSDLSIAWRRSRFSLRASIFASLVHDFITVRDVDKRNEVAGIANARARTWANVDATLVGSEASAALTITNKLFLSGEWSFVRGSQEPRPEDGISSSALPEMPPFRGRAGLRFDDGFLFAAIDAVVVARQDRVNSDLNEKETPGYSVGNAAVGGRRGGLALTLGVQNIFDRRYAAHLSYQRDPFRTGVPVNDPGRTFYVNASARF